MYSPRAVYFGIDGASFTLLNELIDKDLMPNLGELSRGGFFSRMEAPQPDNSAVSWSSIITGTNPGEHGIFGFTDLISGTYTMRFPNYLNLKAPAFWEQNSDQRCVIINLPFTYPAQPLNGLLISGFVSPSIERAVYPETLLSKVKDCNYRIDADFKRIYQSREAFCNDVLDVLSSRVKLYRELFQNENWDVFMIVFTGSDRLGHYALDAYTQQEEPVYQKIIAYFQQVDAEIGWIVERLEQNDQLVMMSDHGMEVVETEVHLNTLLQRAGLLDLPTAKDGLRYTDIRPGTKAFVMEPGRVYLNYSDSYPCGSVDRQDREDILKELEEVFSSLEYNNKKVIKRVLRKEHIYRGEEIMHAPDLVLVQDKGISLRGTIGKQEIFNESDIIKGVHRGDDAFICIRHKEALSQNGYVPQCEDVLKLSKCCMEVA